MKLAAVAIGFFIAVVLGELALIPFVSPARYRYPQPVHDRDDTLGWIPTPNQQSYTIDQAVITNSIGFRSDELAADRGEVDLRVLCVGDSQTFGNGVSQDSTFPARLEEILSRKNPTERVEVINAGVQAYDTSQEVALLTRFAPRVQPDVVVLGFYINDISEVLRQNLAERVKAGEGGEMRRTGTMKGWVPYQAIYLLKRSRIVTLLYGQWRQLRMHKEANYRNAILAGETPERYGEAWDLIARALTEARALSDRLGFRMIVFPVPVAQEFVGEYPNEQYRSRFAHLAGRIGLEYFDPTPALMAEGGEFEDVFIAWDGHINASTHQMIAESLAELISVERSRPRNAITLDLSAGSPQHVQEGLDP